MLAGAQAAGNQGSGYAFAPCVGGGASCIRVRLKPYQPNKPEPLGCVGRGVRVTHVNPLAAFRSPALARPGRCPSGGAAGVLAQAVEMAETVGLGADLHTRSQNLSGGMKRKLQVCLFGGGAQVCMML